MNRNSAPIVGAWKLISSEMRKSDGEIVYPLGENAQGSIVYTESGRFSAQVMRAERPHFASGDPFNGTTEEIEASFKGVVSYYGAYKLDTENGVVEHHVEGSLFPNWEGQVQIRYFELSGNRLNITSAPVLLGGGGEIVVALVWERIE